MTLMLPMIDNPARFAPSAVDLTTGLALYYEFNETSGSTATDQANGVYTFAFGSYSHATDATFGEVLQLGGGYSGLTVANSSAYKQGLPVSFSVWLNTASIGANTAIFSTDNLSPQQGVALYATSSGCGVWTGNGAGYASSGIKCSTSLATGAWVHFVAVLIGPLTGAIYINNVSQSISTVGGGITPTYTSNQADIGQGAAGSYGTYGGKIAHFRQYNLALNSAQVSALYSGNL